MTSPDEFLRELLKIAPGDARAWITVFDGDPGKAGRWTGVPHDPTLPLPYINGSNAFVSVAAFPAKAKARRGPHHPLAVLLDDVGSKAKADDVLKILGAPTARVETSAGNEQWWYFLDAPIDKRDIDDVYNAVKATGSLSDASGLNSIRYGRLPTGINAKPGKGNHPVHLLEWSPERRFSLSYLRSRLGIAVKNSKGEKSSYTAPDAIHEGDKPTPDLRPGDAAGRDDEIFRYGRSIAARFLPGQPGKLLEAMWDRNLARCKPPLSRDEVLAKWKSVCKYHESQEPPEGEYAGADSRIVEDLKALGDDEFVLPNDYVSTPIVAKRMFERLAATRELFYRAGGAVEVDHDGQRLNAVSTDAFRSRLDQRGRRIKTVVAVRDQLVLKPKRCSADNANLLLASLEARKYLPPIGLVSRSSILVEVQDELHQLGPGYHEAAGGVLVFAQQTPQDVELQSAVRTILSLYEDFQFTAPSDKSRAVANLVGPCLRMGRLLPGHALINVVEADESQTGKGYKLAVDRAVYGESSGNILKRKGGVGSFDESLAHQLASGKPFLTLDNVRGRLDSEYLEGVVTMQGRVPVRLPHKGEVEVDARSLTIHMTSNGYQATRDLGNRSLITRLLHQPEGYEFKKFAEGGLLEHVEAQQPRYLGAVFAVVRHWHAADKPRLPTSHSFREWVGALDWIVQNVFDLPPLLEGHEETIIRVTNPALTWLREIAPAVAAARRLGDELSASALVEISRGADVAIPGGTDKTEADDDARRLGTILAPCFRQAACVPLDAYQVLRIEREEWDGRRGENRTVKRYVFAKAGEALSVDNSEVDM